MRSLHTSVSWSVAFLLAATALTGQVFAGTTPPPPTVPEIDPGSAVGALTLLSGGRFLLTDRLWAK